MPKLEAQFLFDGRAARMMAETLEEAGDEDQLADLPVSPWVDPYGEGYVLVGFGESLMLTMSAADARQLAIRLIERALMADDESAVMEEDEGERDGDRHARALAAFKAHIKRFGHDYASLTPEQLNERLSLESTLRLNEPSDV